MIIHDNLLQGSEAWHEFRLKHFGASEAAAMLGLSKTITRTDLLHAKSTGIAKEYSDWVQKNILDYGHEVESLARPIIAKQIGFTLFPVTCSDGIYSCSCDGLTMAGTIAWENKQPNQRILDMVKNEELPEEHAPQCYQILMVTGADALVFSVSDGTEENTVSMLVYPNTEWFDRIRAGWAQFEIDLKNYVPVQITEKPIADAMPDLPALFVQARGEITAHNMEEFGESLKVSLANARNLVLVTDQDYSNAEAAAKLYRETCKKLVLVKEAVLAQATTIGEATRMIDAWHEDLRVTALKLEKDVAEKKETQKLAIIQQAKMDYIEHVTSLELEIKPIRLNLPVPDFAAALKGKRLISAWHDAANTLLANSKILADSQAKDMREKLTWHKESSAGFEFLFNDLAQVIVKPIDDFKLLVTTRIEYQKSVEADKLKAERERIRLEEEAKAKAKIEAGNQAKEEAEAKAKRIQDDLQRAKDEMAKREDEKVAAHHGSEKFAEIPPVSNLPITGDKAIKEIISRGIPSDVQVINVIMDAFGMDYEDAFTLISRVVENMRKAA